MKSISSRYSLKNISNNNYSTITISGTTYPATLNNNGTLSQGYIFAPYITTCESIIVDNEIYKKILREERIRKLDKLKCIDEKNTQ